jgi:lactoylglutathione lyase
MRTLHPAFRVSDAAVSVAFYGALGYVVVGTVEGTALGDLTLLRLGGDEFVSLELVEAAGTPPVRGDVGFSHLAVQVDVLHDIVAGLRAAGFEAGDVQQPGGPEGPRISWVSDPDGYRIESAEWPEGHPLGITEADLRG